MVLHHHLQCGQTPHEGQAAGEGKGPGKGGTGVWSECGNGEEPWESVEEFGKLCEVGGSYLLGYNRLVDW